MNEEKTDKLGYPVDEQRWFQNHLAILKGTHSNDEAVKLAKLDMMVIFLMHEDAYYNNKYNWYAFWRVVEQLRKFIPNLSATDDEIAASLDRCTEAKRLVIREYPHDYYKNTLVKKWVYNTNYWQSEPIINEPNPFNSAEFMKIQKKIEEVLSS
jgi:hypothetical protein